MVAFIDTMALIWWIRREATDGQDTMIQRADYLMATLEAEKADVMVAAISVAEFLRGSSPEHRSQQKAIIEETFICRSFDPHAAEVAANLYEKALTVSDYENRKAHLKADMQIIATAYASKASVLYSHDTGMRKLADACGIEARDLPDMPPTLFEYDGKSNPNQ